MKPHWKITLAYLGFGLVWIVTTDCAAFTATSDPHGLIFIQVSKGWLFVFLSSALVFLLTRQAMLQNQAATREKIEVFQSTIRGAHHILLNYLNQMELVTQEAEKLKDFDREILALSRKVSDQASAELLRLAELETISPEKIQSAVYPACR